MISDVPESKRMWCFLQRTQLELLLPDLTAVLCAIKGSTAGTSEMAQWMNALAAKPYNLSSIPRSHLKVEGELRPIQTQIHTPTPPHTHTTQSHYIEL